MVCARSRWAEWAHSSSSRLLERLLKADCWLGLLRDSDAQSLLKAAVDLGKWAQMRLLLKALTERRFLNLPKPMRVVSESFPKWANKFPADFLHLIGQMPLQPEPEVMGGLYLQDVMLPHMLVRGSFWCCPRALWLADLARYSAGVNWRDAGRRQMDEEAEANQTRQLAAAGAPGSEGARASPEPPGAEEILGGAAAAEGEHLAPPERQGQRRRGSACTPRRTARRRQVRAQRAEQGRRRPCHRSAS